MHSLPPSLAVLKKSVEIHIPEESQCCYLLKRVESSRITKKLVGYWPANEWVQTLQYQCCSSVTNKCIFEKRTTHNRYQCCSSVTEPCNSESQVVKFK